MRLFVCLAFSCQIARLVQAITEVESEENSLPAAAAEALIEDDCERDGASDSKRALDLLQRRGMKALRSQSTDLNDTAAQEQCTGEFSQCGKNHASCCEGATCVMQSMWYSQCIPAGTAAEQNRTAATSFPKGVFNKKGCCAFADSYMCADWDRREVQLAYISDALAAERGFFATAGVSYDADTGLSEDGSTFDAYSGAVDTKHGLGFSAPSKEMIQISLLALSLSSEGTGLVAYTREEALTLLEKKVDAFEEFDATFPAFGGYLPWFCSRGSKPTSDGKTVCRTLNDPPGPLRQTPDWISSLPSLDNGQLAWAAYSAANALSDLAKQEQGEQQARIEKLGKRWSQRVDRMKSTAVPLFFNAPNGSNSSGWMPGTVRIIAHLRNLSQDAANNPNNSYTVDNMVLNGPFEDELMIVWMTLFADWSAFPNDGAAQKDKLWADKADNLFAVNYTTKKGENITVQRGFWASAHEQWKLLVLPYLDIPLVKKIFVNTERARLLNSIDHNFPGLFASSHAPSNAHCLQDSDYCSDEGVSGMSQIGVQWTIDKMSVTPYAAFPSILIDPGAGLAWYNLMLRLPHMQTTAGSVESSDLRGKEIANFLTWDAKATTVLAMLGGTGPQMKKYLERDGHLQEFYELIGTFYDSVFDDKKITFDKPLAFMRHKDSLPLPPLSIGPVNASYVFSDFATCECPSAPVPQVVSNNVRQGCGY
eukprot:TRINITY_DN78043_c0_g1_i1.p1 TRINITY_DN78043_c0_g1~~TRINITY_DN78043_c0_g1_i1.p1  ORF type:complete len:707 (-),score=131.91 TRINITY_DN78043_c0_g1_i1:142-2262(-)